MAYKLQSPCHEVYGCDFRNCDKETCVECLNCATLKTFQGVLREYVADTLVRQDNEVCVGTHEAHWKSGPAEDFEKANKAKESMTLELDRLDATFEDIYVGPKYATVPEMKEAA